MTAVVQGTCPGCRRLLRIPAGWTAQALRCKHCGMTMQARTPAVMAAPAAPRSRPDLPVAPMSAPTAVPVAMGIAVGPPPAVPVASPVTAVPMGVPVGPVVPWAAPPGSAFDGIDESLPSSGRRRSRSSGGWVGTLVGLLLLAAAGGATYYYWPQIAPLFESKSDKKTQVAAHDRKDNDRDPNDPTKKPSDKKPDDKKPVAPKPDDKKPVTPKPDDKKPTPKPDDKKPVTPKPDDKKPVVPVNAPYPRRALVISVHNYLYANPINYGDANVGRRNVSSLLGQLSQTRGFRIAPSQMAHLSDMGKDAHSPVKPVIEKTITDFLSSSRPQDRVLLIFAGHGVEIDGKAYLVPIEGELNAADSLIPLEWVYKQLAECKARQKLFVVDVCRLNPSRGLERPTEGAMSAKFDEALKAPPRGVQVWTACVEGEQSYEFDDYKVNNGMFMDALYDAAMKGVDGVIQKPDDPFPVQRLEQMVNLRLRKDLEPLKLKQTTRVSGDEAEGGAAFDPRAEPAPTPKVAVLEAMKERADQRSVRAILKELNVPPVKKTQSEGLIKFESLPPLAAKALEDFPIDNTPSKLREAVERAQALLWALSPNEPPAEVKPGVDKIKESGELKTTLAGLPESFRAPNANGEMGFKNNLENVGRRVASVLRLLEEELDNMKLAAEERDKAPKRWQANYDFILARLMAQIAYVYEYSSMLGSMRKEFPTRDPAVHGGWRMASQAKLQGDSTGRKLARDAEKLLDKLAKSHPGTPWEILAKRERFTTLGLEWKPEK